MTQSHSTAPFVLDSHLTSQQKFLKLMNEFRMAQEKRPSIYKKFEEYNFFVTLVVECSILYFITLFSFHFQSFQRVSGQ
jgi:hypothetical protein